MKNKLILSVCLSISMLFAGCSLIPKNVEFFQKKVKDVPAKKASAIETERQAAKYLWEELDNAYVAAMVEHASTNVTIPLRNAHIVAPALSLSLGPPETVWPTASTYQSDSSTNLAKELTKNTAKLNEKIDDYRDDTKPLAGKKIEGTGLIQMSYFTYVGILIGLVMLVRFGMNVYAKTNPAAAIGMNMMRIPAQQASKALSEIIEGGEHFIGKVTDEIKDPVVLDKVISLFKSAHMEKQSRDVQNIVDTLTKK